MKSESNLRSAIRAELASVSSPWVDMKGAMAYTGFSRNTIVKWRNWGQIKEYFAPGNSRARFLKSELDAVIRDGIQIPTAGSAGHNRAS